jgi:hypothetical protein
MMGEVRDIHDAPGAPPRPLPSPIPDVPEFDEGLLPTALRGYVVDTADRMQVPLDFIANPLVVALGSTIGRGLGIRPRAEDDWLVVPNFWGATVSPPGVLKSPSTEAALQPLRRLEDADRDRHGLALADANFDQAEAEARLEAVKKDIKVAARNHEPASEELRRRHREAEEALETAKPRRRRRITSDATVEKLAELCAENPEGIFVHRDELNGWVRLLSKEGREGDRQFYLETWGGNGRYTSDRIKRGTTEVRGLCVSLYGTIQPEPLSSIVRESARGGNDGLISRFQLLSWPDISPSWRQVDRAPDSLSCEDVETTFKGVDALRPADFGAPPVPEGDVPAIHFIPEAQQGFDAWFARLERVLAALEAQFLDEERIARVVDRAEALVEDALQTGRLEQDAAELRALERKIRRVGELYADEEDDLEGARIRKQLGDLREKRRELRERIQTAQAGGKLDREHIRTRLAELGAAMRSTMLKGADAARDALAAVLAEDDRGSRKLEIEVDPEAPGGYRITGRWRVAVSTKEETGRNDATGLNWMVAGGRFATDETGRVPVMPYQMRS